MFHKIAEANSKLTNKEARAQYDELMGNPEMHELMPRCVAFVVMMGYWLLHALIDWNDVEGVKENHKTFLRRHILNKGPVNLKGLGLEDREPVEMYVQNEDNDLPFLQQNNREELKEFREMLEGVGLVLGPLPDEEDGGDCVLPKGEAPKQRKEEEEEEVGDNCEDEEDGEEGEEGSPDGQRGRKGSKKEKRSSGPSAAREAAVRKLGYGPSSKHEAKLYKSKMNRWKNYQKKQKGGVPGMDSCIVQ